MNISKVYSDHYAMPHNCIKALCLASSGIYSDHYTMLYNRIKACA